MNEPTVVMEFEPSFQYSILIGAWLAGPLGIIFVGFSVLVMCLWKIENSITITGMSTVNSTGSIFQDQHSPSSHQETHHNLHVDIRKNDGPKLWVKNIKTAKSKGKLRRELHLLYKLYHPNTSPIIGTNLTDNGFFLVIPFYNEGNLKELLSGGRITFSKCVITTFIQDLLSGLAYIHHSPIKCHGQLNTSNCLIDSSLHIRIANFAEVFCSKELSLKILPVSLMDRLWLAPEILRGEKLSPSPKGDMYSLSIILHEIIHRQGPYNLSATHLPDVEYILNQIQKGSSWKSFNTDGFFRPQIKDNPDIAIGCPYYVRRCLEDCWQEMDYLRPEANEVFSRLSVMRSEMCIQTVSSELEIQLADLQKEKEKKWKLLSTFIPSYAAYELLKGSSVKPQTFGSVTLLFANIGNFRKFSETYGPHEHICLVDNMYKAFDAIVQRYKVLKVETMKDTYFVASGLKPSETQHTAETALLALNLINTLGDYRIVNSSYFPVVLRIGIHTGPVAAGIIGLDKPRFCLFGDVVNMTSRLCTTSNPSHIQLSSECHVALVKNGGFIMRERGFTYMKGKGWRKTYWLTGTENRSTP